MKYAIAFLLVFALCGAAMAQTSDSTSLPVNLKIHTYVAVEQPAQAYDFHVYNGLASNESKTIDFSVTANTAATVTAAVNAQFGQWVGPDLIPGGVGDPTFSVSGGASVTPGVTLVPVTVTLNVPELTEAGGWWGSVIVTVNAN